MKKKLLLCKKIIALWLAVVLLISLVPASLFASASQSESVEQIITYYKSNKTTLDSWWELIALKGAGQDLNDGTWTLPQWESEDIPEDTSETSDYVGFILGIIARDENPKDIFEGRNLTTELALKQSAQDGSFSNLVNIHIWAMIALDTAEGDYNQQEAITWLLNQQKNDGGFALSGNSGDTDITGMALQALSPYKSQDNVNQAITSAKQFLKSNQCASGGFSSWGTENANSIATVITGLISIGEDVTSNDWTKDGNSIVDALFSYQLENHSFSYQIGSSSNALATAQALIALRDIHIGKSVYQSLKDEEDTEVSDNNVTVNIRVEGTNENIIDQEIDVISSGNDLTAIDALEQALTSHNISYIIENGPWGKYISSINGENGGCFGGYDGWLFVVNGEMAAVGAGDYQISEDDELIFYYGMYPPDTLIPQINIEPAIPKIGDEVTITVSSSYYDWFLSQNIDVKIENASINFNGQSLLTDENGQVIVSSPALPGIYNLKVSKNNEGSYPGIVRSSDIKVEYTNSQQIENVVNNSSLVVNNEPINISVGNGISGVSLNTSIIDNGTESTSTLPYVNASINTAIGNVLMTIPNNTQITAPVGWNGNIKLPAILPANSVSISNSEVDQVIEVGAIGYSLIFDKPVRLVFPGLSGKSLGFIDIDGNVTNIMTVLQEDSLEAAELIPAGGDAKIDVGNDLVVWTKHFTKFVVFTPTIIGNGGGGGAPITKTVTLSVTGDSGTILSERTVEILSADTPYSILVRELGGSRVKTKGSGTSIYVYEIDGLAEFDRGPLSGWMYSVNGLNPNEGAGSYILNNADRVNWYYTTEMSYELKEKEKDKEEEKIIESKEAILETIDGISKKLIASDQITDWSIFALQRSGYNDLSKHKTSILKYISEKSGYFTSITDLARTILVAKVVGLNPENINGYNLIEKIYNYPNIEKQGSTGPIFSLIALDSNAYFIPDNAKWSRDSLVSVILSYQNDDGGFCLSKGEKSSVDITAMVLQALSNYSKDKNVNTAIQNSLNWLSKSQLSNGGFKELGVETSESISQVIIALTSLGLDPKAEAFTKAEGNLITALLRYKLEDGSFSHIVDGEGNIMASEQALMAFTAYNRYLENNNKLFALTDDLIYYDSDTISAWAWDYVGKASKYKLMEGIKTQEGLVLFKPQQNITRAEFAAVLLRILKEEPSKEYRHEFNDVKLDDWYAGYIQKAKEMGLIKGMSANEFAPNKCITREEMAVMLTRALKLTGGSEKSKLNDIDQTSQWAREAVNSVYSKGIMVGDSLNFNPKDSVTREMVVVVSVKAFEMQQK